jgi:hypothetical protein
MKMCGGMKVKLHTFLISAVDGGSHQLHAVATLLPGIELSSMRCFVVFLGLSRQILGQLKIGYERFLSQPFYFIN